MRISEADDVGEVGSSPRDNEYFEGEDLGADAGVETLDVWGIEAEFARTRWKPDDTGGECEASVEGVA